MTKKSKTHILVIEDEKKLAGSIGKSLNSAGYEVTLSFDGTNVEKHLQKKKIALIILDLNLPRISGFTIMKELREKAITTPVLILSGRTTISDRVQGLKLGGDDYLVKPFDTNELLARIEAILRRTDNSKLQTLKAADIVMNLVTRVVTRGGRTIELTPREFALLEFFVRSKNQVLTRRRIAEQVWGYKFDTGTNIVDVYVSYLRKAIDESFPTSLIHTVHGEGFILRDE